MVTMPTGVPIPVPRRTRPDRAVCPDRTVRPDRGRRAGGGGLASIVARLGVAGYAVSQVILLSLLWATYGMARHLTAGHTTRAYANGVDVWHLERALHLPGEDAVQRLFLRAGDLVTVTNWYYVGVHFPVAVLFGVWVFARHRERWARVRNVVILTTLTALVIHVLYPLAPPRLLPEVLSGSTLVDTGAVFGPSPYAKGSGLANQFAAMPSLHVGWALIEAWGVVTILRSRARWLALAQPVLTFGVVVVTANHYWVDGLVAIVLVTAAVLVTAVVRVSGTGVGRFKAQAQARAELRGDPRR